MYCWLQLTTYISFHTVYAKTLTTHVGSDFVSLPCYDLLQIIFFIYIKGLHMLDPNAVDQNQYESRPAQHNCSLRYAMRLGSFKYTTKSSISDLYVRLTVTLHRIRFPLWHYIYNALYAINNFSKCVIKWVQPPHSPFSCDASTRDCRNIQYTMTAHTIAKKINTFLGEFI